MSFVSRLVSTTAAGAVAVNADVFSDLEDVGLWPSQQNVISKITKIEIWYNTDRINGIQVTYLKTDSTTQTMLHGSAVDDEGLIELTDNEVIAGGFGAVNDSDGALRRLGFAVYNSATGQISIRGPFPSVSDAESGVNGFGFLGEILGFGGAVSSDNLLDAVVFYKAY